MQNYLQVIQPLDMRLMHGARRAQPGDTTTEEPFGRETSSSSFYPLLRLHFPTRECVVGNPADLGSLLLCGPGSSPHSGGKTGNLREQRQSSGALGCLIGLQHPGVKTQGQDFRLAGQVQ